MVWGSYTHTVMHAHIRTHTHPYAHTGINLTAEKLSGPTSSGQPSNPKANYKPHYVLSVLFPHHINSAMRLDRLRTDVKRHRRTEMSPVCGHDLHMNRPPSLFFLFLHTFVFGSQEQGRRF